MTKFNQKIVYSRQRKKQKLDELATDCHRFESLSNRENSSDSWSDNGSSEHNLNEFDTCNTKSNSIISNNQNSSVLHNRISVDLVSVDTSDEEFVPDATDIREIKELQEWAVSNNVPDVQVDGLLKILKRRLLPSLPKSVKTFLNCKVDVSVEKKQVRNDSEGGFVCPGIRNQLLNKIDTKLQEKSLCSQREINDLSSKNSEGSSATTTATETLPLEQTMSTSDEHALDFPLAINELIKVEMLEPINQEPIVEPKTEFEAAVLSLLTSIKEKQNEMAKEIAVIKDTQTSISNFLLDRNTVNNTSVDLGANCHFAVPISSSVNLWAKYHFAIPISTYEDFLSFEDRLKSDQYFRNDIYLELRSLMDKDCVITKSIVYMLKKFMTKEVVSMFTAIRSSTINKNKQKFKPTHFCSLIFGTIIKVRTEKSVKTETEDLNSALTDVLSNAYKWKA